VEWPLLRPLAPEERNAVLEAARERSFAKGEVVFHEGDPADAMHLLVSGRLVVQVATPDGERASLNVLGPGDHVGELALLPHGGRRSASVTALENATTRVLTAAAFHDLCERHPAVQGLLVDLLAQRVKDLSSRLLETMYLPLDRRLYRSLDQLGRSYAAADGSYVVPLTQEQLADLVGGTRPTVNQILQRLADEGIIELGRGRVLIRDPEALRGKGGLA